MFFRFLLIWKIKFAGKGANCSKNPPNKAASVGDRKINAEKVQRRQLLRVRSQNGSAGPTVSLLTQISRRHLNISSFCAMSFRDFWLFLGLVLFVNSQNYPQQQTRQHSNYQYDRQRQDYYRQQTQRPSHHQNYYRTDSPNQYNISAINYSNKFQKSVITSTTSTTVEPPKRYHTSTNQNVYSNVHYRQHHQTT